MIQRLILVTVCIAALFVAAPGAAFDLNLTAGLDFGGEFDSDVSLDADEGFSLGLELTMDLPILELGVGAEYGFDRGGEGIDDVKYQHLYAVARLGLFGPVYGTARLGYADLEGLTSLDGGNTWSIGAGVSLLDKIKVEVLLNNFSAEIEGFDFDYETYSARLVYTF